MRVVITSSIDTMSSCPTAVSSVPPARTDGRRQRRNASVIVPSRMPSRNRWRKIIVSPTRSEYVARRVASIAVLVLGPPVVRTAAIGPATAHVAPPQRRTRCVRALVLPEGQIETAVKPELAGSGAGNDAGHAVIAQSRGAAEDERVARFEQHRVYRIASPNAAKEKPCGVANRERDDRMSRL